MPEAYTAVADKVEGRQAAVMSCVVEPYPVWFACPVRITWVSWETSWISPSFFLPTCCLRELEPSERGSETLPLLISCSIRFPITTTSGHSMEVEAYLGNKIKLDFFSLKK